MSNPTRSFWFLFALTAFILWFRLGATPIYILDEAKNAQCAREMLLRHNWIVPTFNGELRTDKPALHYWFMMLAYKTFGVHEWTARFFATIMGLSTIFATWFFIKKWFDKTTAFFAAIVLCCSAQFLFECRLSVPDPFLIFFTTLGLFALYGYLTTQQWKWILLTAASLALAALAKGPVALALPGLTALAFAFFQKKWKAIFNIKIIAAAVLFFAIAAPWYYAVHKATNGAWTKGFFFEHNLNRFSSTMEGHGGPFIITPLIVLVGLLPFGIFIFSALKSKYQVWRQPFTQFAAIVSLVYLVFFSISRTKLPNYPMPCYPFVAIVLANWLAKFSETRRPIPVYALVVLFIIAVAQPIGGYFALQIEPATQGLSHLALWLSILPISLLFLFFINRKTTFNKLMWPLVLLYSLFNCVFMDVLYPMVYNRNPVTLSMPLIGTDQKVVAFEDYNPAYNFYLPNNIDVIQKVDLLKMIVIKNAAIVLTRKDRLAKLDSTFYKKVLVAHDIFESPTSVILK